MNCTATLPRPDMVSITVSGPSTALAYVWALAAKARGWARAAVTYVKMAVRRSRTATLASTVDAGP